METVVVPLPYEDIAINTAGHIDYNAERVFTRGQCHALALALHRLTGWELYGLYSPGEWRRKETPGHVVVKSPDGMYIDITGDNALEGWRAYWPEATPHALTEAQVLEFEHDDYQKPFIEAAKPYAITLFLLYGKGQAAVQMRLPFGA